MKAVNRLTTYNTIASQLALLTDQQIEETLAKSTSMNSSIGGTTATLNIGSTPIFIKKIRLTDIERQAENIMSTANLFNLPLYYQYGISSGGFGVWRELAAHTMTTNWVLAGECPNFPLMYHWHILPAAPSLPTEKELKEIERSVKYWGGCSAIRRRLEAKQNASADVILFLEYIPETLGKWLGNQIIKNDSTTQTAMSMVEHDLIAVTSFMNSHGLLHFDAHLENILTDGDHLYFTDFGLAISSQFELSKTELNFFENHRNYDQCLVIMSFVNRALAVMFESKERNTILQEYAKGNYATVLSEAITPIVKRYSPIAAVMKDFNQKLVAVKTTPYPAAELEQACIAAGLPLSTEEVLPTKN